MSTSEQITQLEAAIAGLEAQRALLGDALVDAALAPLRAQLAALSVKSGRAAPEPAISPAPAPPRDAALTGERRLVTVLFADIAGFTALAEQMDPEAVRDIVNACFERLGPCIERYGGVIDKYLGDGVMALFGAPVSYENDAERALRAALELRAALDDFAAERRLPIGLHVGVNTGVVVAGGIGAHRQQEYSVMGDAVNVAARLEQVSERGQILVGEDTQRLTQARFDFELLPAVAVKGKAEPVPVYRLLGLRQVIGRERGIAGLESPLVGRQAEFGALQAACQRLNAGQGGILTISGEAGLGKSRLVSEIRRSTPGLAWAEGRCISYGASLPYLPWQDALRNLLRLPAEADAPAFAARVSEILPALPGEAAEKAHTAAILAHMLNIPLSPAEAAWLARMDGDQLREATFEAVESALRAAAAQAPLGLIIEDLHWVDPTSLALLRHVLPLAGQLPLLIVAVFRPDIEHACWALRAEALQTYPALAQAIDLEPLSAEESGALVRNLLHVEQLPAELRQRILSSAEGNPFYMEEIIRTLLDGGAIALDPATRRYYATRDVQEINIPNTLQGVIMARIDRLEEETRHVLQLASVIGRIFFYRVLAAIASETRGLDERLDDLQATELIRERARLPELEYIFKHHLTQEAAYNGLLKKDRRVFHRQVAEALERLFAGRQDEITGLLAYHWERAEDAGRATAMLLKAGDQARLAYSFQEAMDYYRRALVFQRAQNDPRQTARTLLKLGLTCHTAFDFAASRQAFEESFALLQQAGDSDSAYAPAPRPLRLFVGNPSTLDPNFAEDTPSISILNQLYRGLVHLTPELDIVPDAAISWEVLEEGRRFIFHLRPDMRWSDGAPLTAHDFVFSWRRLLDPRLGSPNRGLLQDIRGAAAFARSAAPPETLSLGVLAPDDFTLVVDLEEPVGYFLHLLTTSFWYPLPRHRWEREAPELARSDAAPLLDWWRDIPNYLSCGPFLLESWTPGEQLVLRRNPDYAGAREGNLEWIELKLGVFTAAEGLEMYARGEIDLVGVAATLNEARARFPAEFRQMPIMSTNYIGFNAGIPPFDDERVRQAFAMCIDPQDMVRVVYNSSPEPAGGGFVPPTLPGHSAGIHLPYDPARARALLAEAGFPGGQGFPSLHILNGDLGGQGTALTYLLDAWRKELGVEVTATVVTWPEYVQLLRDNAPAIYTMGWQADYPDPDDYLRIGFWRERVHWENEEFISLVEQIRRRPNQVERMALARKADRLLCQAAMIVPIYYQRNHSLVKPYIHNLRIIPTGVPRWKDIWMA